MTPFKMHRAKNLGEAAGLFKAAEEGRFLAGGQTLIPVLKQRLASPSDLVALSGGAGLAGSKV